MEGERHHKVAIQEEKKKREEERNRKKEEKKRMKGKKARKVVTSTPSKVGEKCIAILVSQFTSDLIITINLN